MGGGELFDRIQKKGHFTERGVHLYIALTTSMQTLYMFMHYVYNALQERDLFEDSIMVYEVPRCCILLL